jgi:hypothetical protein
VAEKKFQILSNLPEKLQFPRKVFHLKVRLPANLLPASCIENEGKRSTTETRTAQRFTEKKGDKRLEEPPPIPFNGFHYQNGLFYLIYP